ncbi:hypothetical protein QBC45DRAFT_322054, partial [Copromyces sp. CBS 386.78]
VTTAKREYQEISRDKEYQPKRGTDRCRCVSLYTPECSETQECNSRSQQHKQRNIFSLLNILAHSNLAGGDTGAGVEACH